MTKSVPTSNKPRKQHTPEFRDEALKLAERIGVAAAARELSLYESQLCLHREVLHRRTVASMQHQANVTAFFRPHGTLQQCGGNLLYTGTNAAERVAVR